MSIEAMKQALEALGCIESPLQVWEINKLAGAMNALRQAIEFEEMVKKGTKAWADTPDNWVDDLRGGVEKQEPVGYLYDWLNPDNREEVIRDWFAASTYVIEKDKGFNVRPLYTSPVHASENAEKQKPVAFRNINTGEFCTGGFLRKDWAKWQPLYTTPREWVGLTDEDIYKVIEENIPPQLNTLFDMAKWVGGVIEAKLKEKNHG